MKVLRRWHPQTFRLGEETIALRLKALTKAEAVEFLRDLAQLGRLARDTDPTDEDAVVAGFKRLQGEFVRNAFRQFVRLDEELSIEDDGGPRRLENSEQLLDELPTGLTFEVLMALQSLCVTNELQGKASASRSGSSSAGGALDPSDSGASPTDGGDGSVHSTAPPTPPVNGACSSQA